MHVTPQQLIVNTEGKTHLFLAGALTNTKHFQCYSALWLYCDSLGLFRVLNILFQGCPLPQTGHIDACST